MGNPMFKTTTIRIPLKIYNSCKELHVNINRICITALHRRIYKPELSIEKAFEKIEFLAKELRETQKEYWSLKDEVHKFRLMKKFDQDERNIA